MSSLHPVDGFAPFVSLPIPVCVIRNDSLVFANRALSSLLALPEGESLVGHSVQALLARFLHAGDQAWVHMQPSRPGGERP